ncbi:competence/damage-inducible protein cinA [Pelagirhabdus alkalitolerans]|uniref:Putative competence-damage inducible protein n=1 Tax=Pelagirhabdus alkalitolerans TaxID=1612202 RepID=A0A1G6H730_9BACI|nr:competence/damage-inducible protein A [Pelagirhabdus alkalitolerans]SDB89246.1 competence/damage-inducible protein cinA [Pelagirhabdus alkalitolerans]
MNSIKAEVIGVGTELLLGQISNTNAQWLSSKLANEGISVYYHQVVGDNPERMYDALKLAKSRSDLVIITGGLGPTEDDITRNVLAEVAESSLELNEQALLAIKAYFTRSDREMSDNNIKQAELIKGAKVIPNEAGTAPGMIVNANATTFISLPGVPREMKSMFIERVIPYLRSAFSSNAVILSKMIRFIGIGESQLEEQVKSLIDAQTNPTIAPLATSGEVALRITAKASNRDEADRMIAKTEKEIEALVGDYIYGVNDQQLNQSVVDLLTDRKQTLAVAESLTGGRFSDEIVSVPGASQAFIGSVVSYSNEAKTKMLHIDSKKLEKEGAVSEYTALEMAKQVKEKLGATYGISFTGVAGPASIDQREIGTVYIAVYQSGDNYLVRSYQFPKDRDSIRDRATKKGLELLYYYLKNRD